MSLSIPSFSPTFPINATSHKIDPSYRLGAGQVGDPKAEFLKEAHKTPAERMQEAILKSLGLTPEEYEALDSDAKAAIDEQIKQKIIEQVSQQGGEQTGLFTDMTV